MQHDVKAFSDELETLDPSSVIDVVLLTQYFNTLREIATESNGATLFMPSTPNAVGDFAGQLRDGILQANQAGKMLQESKPEDAA